MPAKILLIGPTINTSNPQLTGGAIVLFENLLNELNAQKIQYLLVDTNKKNYSNTIFAYISIVVQIFIKQFNVRHISLHSSRDYLFLAPFILLCGKVFNKSTSLRKFGGEAWDTLNDSKGIKRNVLNMIFKNVDFLFLEMRFLVTHFKSLNKNSFWFPNVRNMPDIQVIEKTFSKRFVFISHVKQEKGIDEIVEAAKLLDSSYIIDLYGVIDDPKYSEAYFEEQGVSYKGALRADEVVTVLSSYDVLLLPSYKEGYPGIVIESYSVGRPVITTNLRGLQEIVDDYQTGIMIEVKNVRALKEAMEYFTLDNYEEMSKKSREKFSLFNTEKKTKAFIDRVLQKDT
ncbi:glycosyltransferase [bacterium]|nr:glycosyltransferase [bacterium]MBU1958930.1 glycosyltransferase [bacterium]